jgi:DNA-binding IclR family transcriptional regulator
MRVHMNVGQRLPMYIAALGRSFAAHAGLSLAELRTRFSNLRWEDPPSFETYLAEVEEARENGYAVDSDHYVKGVTTLSAAILDGAGLPVMAISAVGFSAQFDKASIKALGEDLRDRAAEVTRAVSGRPSVVSPGHLPSPSM